MYVCIVKFSFFFITLQSRIIAAGFFFFSRIYLRYHTNSHVFRIKKDIGMREEKKKKIKKTRK